MGYDDYEAAARWYDAAYDVLQAKVGDAEFYLDLARKTGGPVLELGCGTGRVLLPIARAGLAATGLDQAPAMLDVLRRKAPPANLRLVVGSMVDFDLGAERFRLVYSAFRPFQHLLTVAEQLGCLAAVRRHLAPEGLLAFDVFAPDLARIARPEEPESEEVRFEQDGETVIRYASMTRDLAAQVTDVHFRFERRRGDRVVGEERTSFRMRWFHRYEVEHLLARAGFEVVDVYGDFDRRPYDGHGQIITVARVAR
jgi:SAM-dependent methyltransferase